MIQLSAVPAKLTKFTPFVELHGKEHVPGAALRLEFNTASEFLGGFDDELRAFLFHKMGARQHDLADMTADAPNLRFPKLKSPYLYQQAYDESTLTIHIGDREENAIVLPGRVKKPFSLTPMEGGTVVCAMTFHCHPDTDQAGDLYDLQSNDIRISFDSGKAVDPDEGEDDPEDEGN